MAIKYVGVGREWRGPLDRSQARIRDCIARKQNREIIPRRLFAELSGMLDPADGDACVELSVVEQSPGIWAYSTSNIEIDPSCFKPWRADGSPGPQNPPRLTAVLLHELVHVSGGDELDAEFFENRLFTLKDGALPPTESDERDFTEHGYEGEYVRLDPKTRMVTQIGTSTRLGLLKRGKSSPAPRAPLITQPINRAGGTTMALDKQEALAQKRLEKMEERKKQVGVRIVVELTGYIKKSELRHLMNGIRSSVEPHLEGNGGGN